MLTISLSSLCVSSAYAYRWIEFTAIEGPVRIQCTVNVWFRFIYSQKWNCTASLFPKHKYYVLSSNFHIPVSASDLYIPNIGLPILLQPSRQTGLAYRDIPLRKAIKLTRTVIVNYFRNEPWEFFKHFLTVKNVEHFLHHYFVSHRWCTAESVILS